MRFAGLLYALGAVCVLAVAALDLRDEIGVRAFLTLGVVGYNT